MMSDEPQNDAAEAHNETAWNQLARQGQRFTRAAGDQDFKDSLRLLDGNNWLAAGIQGKRLLCLAAGGGRHGPLYAAAGAHVTVVDISPAQLELDRVVAAERQLAIRTIQTSMTHLTMFSDGTFDIVIHPVSTCYLADLGPVYREVARVTRPGGLYISQHKQPVSLQVNEASTEHGYHLGEPYYRKGPLPSAAATLHREEGTLEYLHRWEQLLGIMCRCGFAIEDLCEPRHDDFKAPVNTFGHRSQYVAPYVRVKARRHPNQTPLVLA